MTEFHDRHTISRLTGAAPGYVGFGEGGQLTEAVRRKPYAVLLLDEIEKAHPDVAMILLQILDEGSLTDSQGRKVDFKNTIIVATSNLGSHILAAPDATDETGTVLPQTKRAILDTAQAHFPPELLNRLDAQVVFNKLSRDALLEVVSLRLLDVQKRLDPRGITLFVDEPARQWLMNAGYSDIYGARAIARTVREHVTNPLAQKLLAGTIRERDEVKVTLAPSGEGLYIVDNHEPDREAALGSAAVNNVALEEEEDDA